MEYIAAGCKNKTEKMTTNTKYVALRAEALKLNFQTEADLRFACYKATHGINKARKKHAMRAFFVVVVFVVCLFFVGFCGVFFFVVVFCCCFFCCCFFVRFCFLL